MTFEKDFLKFMINADFRKTIGNVRKHRDIKNQTIIQQNFIRKVYYP